MPLFDRLKHGFTGIDWLAITRILVIQVVVLCALTYAGVRYIEWTSNTAQAEFGRDLGKASAAATEPLVHPAGSAQKHLAGAGRGTCLAPARSAHSGLPAQPMVASIYLD
jgi:hypothetical protein